MSYVQNNHHINEMLFINNNSINEMPNRKNNYMSETSYFNSNSFNDQKEILVPQKVYNWLDEEKIYLFSIDKKRYEYHSFISDEGTLGPVALFHDNNNNKDICIKKIERPYETCTRGKKVLKLISILTSLNENSDKPHPNIIQLREIYIPEQNIENYDSVYLMFDNIGTNLERMILSDFDYFEDERIIPWIMYQILRGVYFIHCSGIIHRNLKPSHILIDENCRVKITGFGNSIYKDNYENTKFGEINEFISEKDDLNYHGPEVLSSKKKEQTDYDERADIWSIGVIFLELLTRTTPIFRPDKKVKTRWESHLMSIFKILGKPDKETIMSFASKERCKDILKFKYFPKVELKDLYPNVDKLAIDLLEKLLCIEPKKRISILEAKKHKYFDIIKEWTKKTDFNFDGDELSFKYQKEIDKMERDNEYYDEQLKYYKKNIKETRFTSEDSSSSIGNNDNVIKSTMPTTQQENEFNYKNEICTENQTTQPETNE